MNTQDNGNHEMKNGAWTRAIMYQYKCEKGAQMYRIGISGYVDKIRVTNIPHARLYIDDVILQDILGDTVVDITAYMQCIYKELKTHIAFPTIAHDAAASILKQSGNSRLDHSDKKLISANDITVDALMTLSRYDRKFNALNTAKCSLVIWDVDADDNIATHEWRGTRAIDTRPRIEYTNYVEPRALQRQEHGLCPDIVDVTQFESRRDGVHNVAAKIGISGTHRELCCIIL
ncbi:hypothetical protein F-LCD7_0053 [Faustovirus]|nr:hypothetical protein F-LCD7_0053 [Faustovirus]